MLKGGESCPEACESVECGLFKKVLQFLGVLCTTLVVTLSLLELAVRFLYPLDEHVEVSCVSDGCRDSQNWLRYFVPQVESFFFYQEGAWRLRPGKRARITDWQSGEELFVYESNEEGFRGPTFTSSSQRVLVAGDSVTFGYRLKDSQVWVRQLEQQLQSKGLSVEVINGGIPSNGLAAYALLLEEQIRRSKPDIVVLGLVMNDLRFCCSVRMYTPPELLSGSMLAAHFFKQYSFMLSDYDQSILYGELAAGQLGQWQQESLEYVRQMPPELESFGKLIEQNNWHFGIAWSNSAWKYGRQKLELISKIAKKNSLELLVVQFPLAQQVRAELKDTYPQQTMLEISKDLGFSYLDLLPHLRSYHLHNPQQKLFIDSLHLTAKGNAVVASSVEKYLVGKLLSMASPIPQLSKDSVSKR